MVSWASFLIPPDSFPGRCGLLAGLVLCLINILINILTNSPNVEGVNNLAEWMIICFVMVALAFMEYFAILCIMRNRIEPKGTELVETRNSTSAEIESHNDVPPQPNRKQITKIIDTYAVVLTPILFLVTAKAYFIIRLDGDLAHSDLMKQIDERFTKRCSSFW